MDVLLCILFTMLLYYVRMQDYFSGCGRMCVCVCVSENRSIQVGVRK